ncbi:MAG: ABC transporter ATP-binding protein [Acidimicrobiales bacterium]
MLLVEDVSHTYGRPRGLQRRLIRTASNTDVPALSNIDLRVAPGEVVGLVGPNGAGKTTLMKIISTLLEPTSGHVSVCGFDVKTQADSVRQVLGLVLSDDRALYWRLTGRRNLEFFGVMQGLTRAQSIARADELLQSVGLAARDRLVFGYSSGMRSRLSIARGLLHRPRVLVLDEPTRALDPVAAMAIGQMLRRTAEEGVAVLLSSHRLEEIERVCDRIVAIVGGGVRFDGTASELAGQSGFAQALHDLLTSDDRKVEDDVADGS